VVDSLRGVKIKTILNISKSFELTENADLDSFRRSLDDVLGQVAGRFSLYNSRGNPRKATIIDTIAKTSCLACITRKLSEATARSVVDALYMECHMLAVNILVEELCNFLSAMGYNVIYSTEAELEYGRADVVVTVTRYGVNLKSRENELMVEVKTGRSLSLAQLFRYLLQDSDSRIVVWRIRNRQILVFKRSELEPLLIEFVKMICLRAKRLLASPAPTTCQHRKRFDYRPSQDELQEWFQDFVGALMETLPRVLETIAENLGVHKSEAP